MIPDIQFVGHSLSRPECVLATRNGDVFCSHGANGVARICPDGRQFRLAPAMEVGGLPVLANGIALRPDGSFLVANIADGGGLLVLDDAGLQVFHSCTTGNDAPPVNFVLVDELGKTWITVSSTCSPRSLAYNRNTANGYVALIEGGELQVVIDNLAYTNEIRTDYENGWLYIAETMGGRISRIRLDEKGVHGKPEAFATMPQGAFVDGLELDSHGHVLAACIVSCEILRFAPDGSHELIAGERHQSWVDEVVSAFEAGQMGRPHLDKSPAQTLRNPASLAFCGSNLNRIVCGNLLDDKLPAFNVAVTGRKPVHWDVEVPFFGEEF